MEGLKPKRAARMFRGPLRHRFIFGRGMVSDDTEHACLTALALLRARGDEEKFVRQVASGLRAWLMTVPAGAGLATLKASLRLYAGVSPHNSGVPSAGNGPAMRAPILGAYFGNELSAMRRYVELSSRVTHTDARAVDGAYLVAVAASGGDVLEIARSLGEEWRADLMARMLEQGAEPYDFAAALGLQKGVSGYVMHTVPVALYCSLSAQTDFRKAIEAAVGLGGDTDTVGAIVGGIVGARVGRSGIPSEWIEGLLEWPRSVGWMSRLGQALAEGSGAPATIWPGYIARSPIFIATVLAHGFRRILPPY